MTNREWMLLISKEFNVSHTVAKGMLFAMYKAKRYLLVPKAVHEKEAKDREYFNKLCEEEEFNRTCDYMSELNY